MPPWPRRCNPKTGPWFAASRACNAPATPVREAPAILVWTALMKTLHTPLVAALLLAGAQFAFAAPRQNDVVPPGGFVNACAAPSGGGGGFWAGDDFTTPTSTCDPHYFSGSGSASGSASSSAPSVSNQSAGTVKMGWAQMSAENHSLAATSFAAGMVNGGYADTLTVQLAGHVGESAYLLVNVKVNAAMWAAGYAGSSHVQVTPYLNKGALSSSNPGYNDGSSNHWWGTSNQVADWGVATYGINATDSLNVNEFVTFSVPVVIGNSFELGLYTLAAGGQRASGGNGLPTETAQGGVALTSFVAGASLMLGGQMQSGFSIASASGMDWAAPPVPEPQTWLLMGLGMVALLVARRRPVA